MSVFNKRGRTRGESIHSKAIGKKANDLRAAAYKRHSDIEKERKKIEKYSNPIPITKGPRQQIIDYVNIMEKLGISPSIEDIVEYMQKKMKNADRDYVEHLINQVRTPTIIAYYKYRSGIASRAIKDIVKKYPDINRLKVAKTIQRYRVNPSFLTKTEKAQVDEALRKIITEANKENIRDDGGDER